MPSISGFLEGFLGRLRNISHGFTLGAKIKLLIYAILWSFPRTIRWRFPPLNRTLCAITDSLIKGTIVSINGIKYSLVDNDSLIIILSPNFEGWIWDYLRPNVNDVFVDVGAHVGKYALKVADLMKKGLVVAIEPNPENYKALLKGIKLNNLKNVIALNIAAFDKNCWIKLFIGEMSGHHTLKRDLNMGYIEVKAKALDNVLKELALNRVDWIKIDVEGAEVEVLKGLENSLKKYHPKLIIEVWNENFNKLLEFMEKLGYSVNLIESSKSSESVYVYCIKH